MTPSPENILARKEIIELLKSKLIVSLDLPYQAADIHEDIPLIGAGLGLDSLDILEIVLCIEGNFGVKVPQLSVHILRSLNTVVDFIIEERRRQNV